MMMIKFGITNLSVVLDITIVKYNLLNYYIFLRFNNTTKVLLMHIL